MYICIKIDQISNARGRRAKMVNLLENGTKSESVTERKREIDDAFKIKTSMQESELNFTERMRE